MTTTVNSVQPYNHDNIKSDNLIQNTFISIMCFLYNAYINRRDAYPANTTRLSDVVLMPGHRLRRLPSIKPPPGRASWAWDLQWGSPASHHPGNIHHILFLSSADSRIPGVIRMAWPNEDICPVWVMSTWFLITTFCLQWHTRPSNTFPNQHLAQHNMCKICYIAYRWGDAMSFSKKRKRNIILSKALCA